MIFNNSFRFTVPTGITDSTNKPNIRLLHRMYDALDIGPIVLRIFV